MSTAKLYDFSSELQSRSSRMENQKQGHFALFRSVLSKDWGRDTAKLSLWVRLIGGATHKPRRVDFSGVKWDLNSGQLVTKINILARNLIDSKGKEKTAKQVRGMLDFFVSEKMISYSGNRHGTVISILNYTDYQGDFGATKEVSSKGTKKTSNSAASGGVEVTKLVTNKVEQNKKLLEQELKHTPNPLTGVEMAGQENPVKKPRKASIPYEAIMSAYNEEAGQRLPHAEALNAKRKRDIKRLFGELKEPTVEAARNYFSTFMCSAKPFYFGDNDTGWRASFDYLLRSETLMKTREGSL